MSVYVCANMYICLCCACVRVHVCVRVFLCGVHVCVSARRCDCDCACMLECVSAHARLFMCAYEYMCAHK